MMEIKFDISNGNIFFDGKEIAPTSFEELIKLLNAKLGNINIATNSKNRFLFDKKITTLSSSGSLILEFKEEGVESLCILFDEVAFFDKSILESKIVKRFEKKYNIKIQSPHPAVAKIGDFSWGDARFLYDPRQGDLSLCFSYILTGL